MGGGLFLGGSAETGYNMPASVFDKEFRCTFDLLETIPSATGSAISVKDEFFTFDTQHPFNDRVHVIDRNGRRVPHAPRFGLSVRDGLDLVRLGLTPEAMLDGRRIEEFFSPRFFSTEFWLLWSTIFGSLPQHSATEFRRYMNRALGLFPDLSDLRHVLRTPVNQYQAFIEPLVAWLRPRGVNFLASAFVRDIGFAPSDGRRTVNRVDYERDGAATSVAVAADDLVLVTTGSQVEDLSVGSMTEAPRPRGSGRSSALWKRLAQKRTGFGNPDLFFSAVQVPSSRWVTFTVTTTGTEFLDQLSALTGSKPGLRRACDFEKLGLVAVADDLLPTGSHRPTERRKRLVGLRLVSGTQRRLCAETHGCMHRRGDPRGSGAPTTVRPIGQDKGLINLHPLRYALCEQYLDAAQPHRQASHGSGGRDQSRTDRPVCRGSAGYCLHHRILGPHGVGSSSPPAQARPRAAARLSRPIRSKGAVRRAQGVCLSVTTSGRLAQLRPDHSFRAASTAAPRRRHVLPPAEQLS